MQSWPACRRPSAAGSTSRRWVARVVGLEKRAAVAVAPGPDEVTVSRRQRAARAAPHQPGQANAVDATRETAGGVAIGWSVDGGQVPHPVLDEGPGLADTTNLFVPFFTTKPGGSGIGLALSRQIADAHGGCSRSRTAPAGPAARPCLPLPRAGSRAG